MFWTYYSSYNFHCNCPKKARSEYGWREEMRRNYVRRIYVVQFPIPRFLLVFTYITRTYTHVAIASVFKKVKLSLTFFAAVCGYAAIYPIIRLDFVTWHHLPCGKPFWFFFFLSPSIYMGKHSDEEALLVEKVRAFPAIIFRTDYRTKLHERSSERKRLASGHVGFEPAIRKGRLKSFLLDGVFRKYL